VKRLYLLSAMLLLGFVSVFAQSGGELRFCLRSEPKTFNPLLVEDESSEAVRYLTGGVLVRVNRLTLIAEPALAISWKVSEGGKRIRFKLREGLKYSDGTPFSAADVAHTMEQLMDPALHSSTGDAFRSAEGKLATHVISANEIEINFPAPVANLVNLFDPFSKITTKRNGGSGTVLCCGEKGRVVPAAEAESLLLEERFGREAASIPGLRAARY
jgi:peptide/nickel transport system substrate-binding protein